MTARAIRTLFLCHDTILSGAQKSLLSLLGTFDRGIIDPLVVVPGRGEFLEHVCQLDLPAVVRPITRWIPFNQRGIERLRDHARILFRTRARVRALREVIKEHDIDVVYTNTVCPIEGALAARGMKLPHVWHVREYIQGNSDLRPLLPSRWSCRVIAGLSRHIITNSHSVAAEYNGIAGPTQLSVVHNGIDLQEFFPDPHRRIEMRRRLGLSPTCKVVSLIGTINPRKGHLLFVEAAAHVRDAGGDVVFLVAGMGPDEFVRAVRQHVQNHRLEERFHFLGWRPDIPDVLRATDVLVAASEQEAFGRSLIEAMATGVPVVATRSGGPEEVVLDGETGFLVPLGDPRSMAVAISLIVDDAGLAQRLGAAAQQRAAAAFSIRTSTAAVTSILADVARSASSVGAM